MNSQTVLEVSEAITMVGSTILGSVLMFSDIAFEDMSNFGPRLTLRLVAIPFLLASIILLMDMWADALEEAQNG